ncbi:MAG: hypothetical protein ACXVNM_07765 [Bacteroidia bacterium]
MKKVITGRTSQKNIDYLKELADQADIKISALLHFIIDDYINNTTIQDKLNSLKPAQEMNEKLTNAALQYMPLRMHLLMIFTFSKKAQGELNKGQLNVSTAKELLVLIENAVKETGLKLP